MSSKRGKRTLAELVASIERNATHRFCDSYRYVRYTAFGQHWMVTYNKSGTPTKLVQLDADGRQIQL